MYMAGGEYPDGSASKAVWRFDPMFNVWQELAQMLTPRSELGMKDVQIGYCVQCCIIRFLKFRSCAFGWSHLRHGRLGRNFKAGHC